MKATEGWSRGCRRIIAVALLAAKTTSLLSQTPNPVPQCGVERWPVKILADADRGKLRTEIVASTVADLGALPTPATPFPHNARIAPHEFVIFRVQGRVIRIRGENDGDLHVVLEDPMVPGRTLITEIPDSACSLGTGREAEYAAARRALRGARLQGLVEVEGVGFFDPPHGQYGSAPNGFELHPVLRLRLLTQQPLRR